MKYEHVVFGLVAIGLFGCGGVSSPDYEQRGQAAGIRIESNEVNKGAGEKSKRVTVVRIDVISDSLAYYDKRGVYLIRDNETGREFIGVSGVGIAETGSHLSGKVHRQDER